MDKLFLVLLALIAAPFSVHHAFGSEMLVEVASEKKEIVIPAAPSSCVAQAEDPELAADIPDAPLRLVQKGDGTVLGFASHYNNRIFDGQDTKRLRRSRCESVFTSGLNADPSALRDHEWLVAPYILSNGLIYGIVHNEYHGARYNTACRRRVTAGRSLGAPTCTYASLSAAISFDGGRSFERVKGDRGVIAAPTERFREDSNWFGIHDPTNIVKNLKDGYFYFLATSSKFRNMDYGVCLFRTKDLIKDPWMAWDGRQFNLRMRNPYDEPINHVGRKCHIVFPRFISSIIYYPQGGVFIGVGIEPSGGVYYTTSPDLVTWSPSKPLLNATPMYSWRQGDANPSFYFSLVGETKGFPNFEITEGHPYLYFVLWKTGIQGLKNSERDVVRLPLRVRELEER